MSIRWHNKPTSPDLLNVRWGAKWLGWVSPADAKKLARARTCLYFQDIKKRRVEVKPYKQ
jgi:hypothetical protein